VTIRDKVVLITGASKGIGAACAAAFANRGAILAVAARSKDELERVAGRDGLALAGDLTDPEFRVRAVDDTIAQFGRIDVLVNNAGVGLYAPSWSAPVEEARAMFELNVMTAVAMTQLVIPAMRARRSGSIVNVSSIGGTIPLPWMSLYSATKFALTGWTDGLRMELSGDGIHVMNVSPGYVKTDFHDHAMGGSPPEGLRRTKKFGATAEQVAEAIVSGVEREARSVVTPGIGRWFSALYRIAPRIVEWQMMKMNRS
jgi:short-subunit dehydrogenase